MITHCWFQFPLSLVYWETHLGRQSRNAILVHLLSEDLKSNVYLSCQVLPLSVFHPCSHSFQKLMHFSSGMSSENIDHVTPLLKILQDLSIPPKRKSQYFARPAAPGRVKVPASSLSPSCPLPCTQHTPETVAFHLML